MVVMLSACRPEPVLSLSPDSLSFTESGGSQTVQVTANYPWTASVRGSGFSISPSSGEGSGTITVTASPASSPDEVTGSLTIWSEDLSAVVTLSQAAKPTLILGDGGKVPAEGGMVEVQIQYNTDYTVEIESSAQSWIHYVETKALQSGKLVFRVDPYEKTDAERSGMVTLKDKSGKAEPVTVTIVQEMRVFLELGVIPAIPFCGGLYYIPFESNTSVTVSIDGSAEGWVSFRGVNREDGTQLSIYVSANQGEERRGSFTVADASGKLDPIVVDIVQEASPEPDIYRILLEFYDAMDGPNWKGIKGWNKDSELYEWSGVQYSPSTGALELSINGFGIKGEIPDCLGDLSTLVRFSLKNEPGVTGSLPPSFRKLVNLKSLFIENTSLTSLPDVFSDMPELSDVWLHFNSEMTGPLPESLGNNDDMRSLFIVWNAFTGTPPPSWAKNYKVMNLSSNHLTGKIPDTYLTGERVGEKLDVILMQQEGYGFDLSDIDIKGYWPDGYIKDVITGQDFRFDDVVSKNNYTVFLSWAPWCPFSKALMPQLLDYYKQYRQDGLEIVSTVILNPDGTIWENLEEQIETIEKQGYDGWYNYHFSDYRTRSYSASTPVAEVYDREGNILFSYSKYPGNDNRHRFGHPAVTDLIPFLETLFGPAEIPDNYTSTDYSRDGEVLTLQKASVGNGINIVFMGDAYTDRDMGKGGMYETVMRQAMEEFFSIEPYKTFRKRFNVYAVKVVSANGRIGDGYSTALGSSFGNGTEIGGLVDKCYEYALKVPGINSRNNLLVNVIANTKRHCGTAYMSESTMSSVTFTSSLGNDPEFMGPVLRHEAGGHGFAFLADEYFTHQGTVPQSQIDFWNELYSEYGWYSNIDFTDDPSKIRWSAFLSDGRYKDEVGIFEGGGLYSLGTYRPSQNSMMNENFEYYNAPSRWAIYQRIMKLSGEEYSFDKFLEYDAVNRGKARSARPPLKAAAHVRTAPPVILP